MGNNKIYARRGRLIYRSNIKDCSAALVDFSYFLHLHVLDLHVTAMAPPAYKFRTVSSI